MKAKSEMTFVRMTWCALILFTVTVVMAITENVIVSILAGKETVLNCYNVSTVTLTSAIWKIKTKNGTYCLLAYTSDMSQINCSERIVWQNRPDEESDVPALKIREVKLTDEGTYTCEIANQNGNFHQNYTLTVLVPPEEVILTLESNGTAVCKAAAGKPAAQISWAPQGDHHTVNEDHPNGTVTVLSTYSIHGTKEDILTCLVSHPTWSKTRTIKISVGPMYYVRLVVLPIFLGILLLLSSIYLWKHCSSRSFYGSKIPESTST
uniref:Ig-like domain-containing protein n=1 Tax=Sphenodon punctatus TaxID=8508 RepID=A0A8D0GC88_SPHPU